MTKALCPEGTPAGPERVLWLPRPQVPPLCWGRPGSGRPTTHALRTGTLTGPPAPVPSDSERTCRCRGHRAPGGAEGADAAGLRFLTPHRGLRLRVSGAGAGDFLLTRREPCDRGQGCALGHTGPGDRPGRFTERRTRTCSCYRLMNPFYFR